MNNPFPSMVPPPDTVQAIAGCGLNVLPKLSFATAVNCWVEPLDTVAVAGLTLMAAIGPAETVRVSVAVPVPLQLGALSVTLLVPDALGVPVIAPVLVFTFNPAGRPLAP